MNDSTKISRPMSFRLEAGIANKLEAFCDDSGLTKTKAVEKALEMYIDDYYEKQKILEEALNSK